jgi:hypothetical protein
MAEMFQGGFSLRDVRLRAHEGARRGEELSVRCGVPPRVLASQKPDVQNARVEGIRKVKWHNNVHQK